MRTTKHCTKQQRGSTLISALAFMIVISLLLAGIGTLCVSHYARSRTESDYAAALNLAEAGANFEFRKISQNPAAADQVSPSAPSGATYSLGSGTFTVYCANRDGSTPWSIPGKLIVVATGTVNGASRTLQVSAKGFPPAGNYAIYTMDSISIWHGSSMEIVGDVGTNGQLSFSGTPGIQGSIYFNGPNAGWYGGIGPSGYTVYPEPQPIQWDTVDAKASALFPASAYPPGGMAYLATHNDNAKASPAITGNSITSGVTLHGPGNYYVTDINLTGNNVITLDNTNGPINLWVGPSGGTGTCRFRGGTAAVSATQNPANACHIFVATQSGIDLAGNEEIDAAIYAYNKDALGNEYGVVQNSGNPTLNGQILADQVNINGNVTVNYVPGLIKPISFGYYGFDNAWVETNGVNQ
jgi:Tfp pilus assembly protein PilX